METQFYILLSVRTTAGFDTYGQYFLGDNREAAKELFAQLKGNEVLPETSVLHIDLMETINELPVQIKTICCTLDELALNSKLIAREIFRQKNLRELM